MYRTAGAVIVAVLTLLSAGEASAFGDTCRKDVSARGSVQGSMTKARNASISAWETQTARAYGNRYANWWYSGDRTIDCTWDASGRRIRCIAVAIPCASRWR